MKKTKAASRVALALTWDGTRWPVRSLPPMARAFLKASPAQAPARRSIAALAAAKAIREIRICWVPCLKGGDDTLADPFVSSSGKRVAFRAMRTMSFGDVLGVVYRR
jgi:hypothetical protein